MNANDVDANNVIDNLGGTFAVARLCQVRPPSVSEWRRTGIPAARLMYLRVIRPDVFDDSASELVGPPADMRGLG
ncbi:MAG: Rha family transcriptional regulator [Rhodanobacter sp.]